MRRLPPKRPNARRNVERRRRDVAYDAGTSGRLGRNRPCTTFEKHRDFIGDEPGSRRIHVAVAVRGLLTHIESLRHRQMQLVLGSRHGDIEKPPLFLYSYALARLLPGIYYSHHGDLIAGSHGYATFFSFYFMMTGLHGIHILAGIGLLSWIAVRAGRGEFSNAYYTPVDLVGLFWHLVDP